jgi:hypothetical protein
VRDLASCIHVILSRADKHRRQLFEKLDGRPGPEHDVALAMIHAKGSCLGHACAMLDLAESALSLIPAVEAMHCLVCFCLVHAAAAR